MKIYCIILSFLFQSIAFANYNTAIGNAQFSKRAFDKATFSWTAIHGDINKKHFELDILHSPEASSIKMYLVNDDERKWLHSTLIRDKKWYVETPDAKIVYRPYEAHYNLASTYYYLMKSKVQFFNSANKRKLGYLRGKKDNNLHFYRKVTEGEKVTIRQRVDLLKNQLIPNAPTRKEKAALLRQAKRLLEMVSNGKLSIVDEHTGVITLLDTPDGSVKITNFTWVSLSDKDALSAPQGYKELTQEPDISNSALFSFSGNWKPGSRSLQTDGRLYNLRKGQMRRIPFKGSFSIPHAIIPERQMAIITGAPLHSTSSRPYIIDLKHGRQSLIGGKDLAQGHSSELKLSPDKSQLALIYTPLPYEPEEKQVVIINLRRFTLRHYTLKEMPTKISWSNDNSSLFISTKNSLTGVSSICHFTQNGNIKYLIQGSNPQVLHKEKRLLFL
ncbi:MAG: hypothetical protein HRT88_09800, partial [Lentisphaeraceae bacterium]|nr:hypothetical protein [Lentisphaeraceae bacterium]